MVVVRAFSHWVFQVTECEIEHCFRILTLLKSSVVTCCQCGSEAPCIVFSDTCLRFGDVENLGLSYNTIERISQPRRPQTCDG